MNLATIRFRGGQYESASQTFLRLPAEFPKSSLIGAAHLNAGFALYELARYQRAMEEFDRAGADKRQAVAAGYWKGLSEKALGDYRQALGRLEGAARARSKRAARRRSSLLLGRMRAADGSLRQGQAALSGGGRKVSQGRLGRRRTALCRRSGHARRCDR